MQSEMNRLRDEMDRLVGRLGVGSRRLFAPRAYPALNMWEDDCCLHVEAELAGLELDDLEIFVNGDNQLTVQGERKEPSCREGAWHRREREFGKFSRMIELPSYVASNKVEATLKNGVLTVTLPKREEAKPRRIEVKAD
jgi:HSP20 family protein